MDKRNTLGTRLAELRCNHCLSQKELAEKVGLSLGTIGNIERGQTEPSARALINLADLFGVSIDFLVGRGDAA